MNTCLLEPAANVAFEVCQQPSRSDTASRRLRKGKEPLSDPRVPSTVVTTTFESPSIYRVTVRGQFSEISQEARSYLQKSSEEHDIFKSQFTEEGTFTYDKQLVAFNLRYELRTSGASSEQQAIGQAVQETEKFLQTMRIGYKRLRASAMDMSSMSGRSRTAQK